MICRSLFATLVASFMIGTTTATTCFMNKDDGSLQVNDPQTGEVGEFLLEFGENKWLYMNNDDNFKVKGERMATDETYDWIIYYVGKQTFTVTNLRKNGNDHYCWLKYDYCVQGQNYELDECKIREGCADGDETACKGAAYDSCAEERRVYCFEDGDNLRRGECRYDMDACLMPLEFECERVHRDCTEACETSHTCEAQRDSCDGVLVEFHTIKARNIKYPKHIGMKHHATSSGKRRFIGVDDPLDYRTLVYEAVSSAANYDMTADGVLRPGPVDVDNACGEVYVGMYEEAAGTIHWIFRDTIGSDVVSTPQIERRQVITICTRLEATLQHADHVSNNGFRP